MTHDFSQETALDVAQKFLRPLTTVLLSFVFILAPWICAKVSSRPPPGCIRIGIKGRSHMTDQYDSKYTSSPGKDITLNEKIGKVKALHIFPIKSCGAIEFNELYITKTGPKFDRQFAFARYHTYSVGDKKLKGWNKITQREYPKMALVKPEVWIPDPSTSTNDATGKEHVRNGGCLVISFPRRASLSFKGLFNTLASLACKITHRSWQAEPHYSFQLPLQPCPERIKELGCPSVKVQIWSDNANGWDMRTLVPKYVLDELKSFLGVESEFAIFRTDSEKYREVYRNAPRFDELGYQAVTGFADSYPLHLLNLASVHNIATYLPKNFGPLDARRFRSNILITGPAAHSEDYWSIASIGTSGLQVHLTDHTTRCQLPCVDPTKGVFAPYRVAWHAEPLRALLGKSRSKNPIFLEPLKAMRDPARANRCIDRGAKGQACLGMQMVPRFPIANGNRLARNEEEASIRVGDDIVVFKTGEHVAG